MEILKKKYLELNDIKTVAILADPACRTCWKDNTPGLLDYVWKKHRPGLFLVAGDLAVHGASDEYQDILSALDRYPALMAAVPGDHDRPLRTFTRYFGSTRKVLDVGKWRFICLNTANRIFLKSEADFLERHVRANTMIVSHMPPGMDGWTFHSLRPLYSNRFLSIIIRNASKIKAGFFGHIHGYSRRVYSGIPLYTVGGVAETYAVRNNRYDGPGFFQLMLFNTGTGRLFPCKLR